MSFNIPSSIPRRCTLSAAGFPTKPNSFHSQTNLSSIHTFIKPTALQMYFWMEKLSLVNSDNKKIVKALPQEKTLCCFGIPTRNYCV